MTAFLDEAQTEVALFHILRDLGWQTAFGPDIAHDGTSPERSDYAEVLLIRRLRKALGRLNPHLPPAALEEALRKLQLTETPSLLENNRRNHQRLLEGVPVEYRKKDGPIQHDNARLVDWDNPENNEFLAVNQFTVIEGPRNRRADVVLFINGLPLVVVELKNPADANATIKNAFNQLQTYQHDIPSLFAFNELLIISDGLQARAGTLTADWERFIPWRTIDGTDLAPDSIPQMDVLTRGICEPTLKTIARELVQSVRKNVTIDWTVRESARAGTAPVFTQGSGNDESRVSLGNGQDAQVGVKVLKLGCKVLKLSMLMRGLILAGLVQGAQDAQDVLKAPTGPAFRS